MLDLVTASEPSGSAAAPDDSVAEPIPQIVDGAGQPFAARIDCRLVGGERTITNAIIAARHTIETGLNDAISRRLGAMEEVAA